MIKTENEKNWPNSGKVFSDETREKMSLAKKGKRTGTESHRAKSVLMVDINTKKIIAIFGTGVEAEAKTGVARTSISQAAKGRLPTAGGQEWMFLKDNTNESVVGGIAKRLEI